MGHESPLSARTLRLTLGTSLAFGVGQLVGWRLACLVPLLTVLLLKAPQAPSLKTGAGLLLTIAGVFGLALVFILPLWSHRSC